MNQLKIPAKIKFYTEDVTYWEKNPPQARQGKWGKEMQGPDKSGEGEELGYYRKL